MQQLELQYQQSEKQGNYARQLIENTLFCIGSELELDWKTLFEAIQKRNPQMDDLDCYDAVWRLLEAVKEARQTGYSENYQELIRAFLM